VARCNRLDRNDVLIRELENPMTRTEQRLSQLYQQASQGDKEALIQLQTEFARPLQRILKRHDTRGRKPDALDIPAARQNGHTGMSPANIAVLLQTVAHQVAKRGFHDTITAGTMPTVRA
jgi:hypothetical protein